MKKHSISMLALIAFLVLAGVVCWFIITDPVSLTMIVPFMLMIVMLMLPLGWAGISQYAVCSLSKSVWIRLIPIALTLGLWILELNFHFYTFLLDVLGLAHNLGHIGSALCPVMLGIHIFVWVWHDRKTKHNTAAQ